MAIYRRGVSSIKKVGEAALKGDVVLNASQQIGLSQIAQDLYFSVLGYNYLDWYSGASGNPYTLVNMVFIGKDGEATTGEINMSNIPPWILFTVYVVDIANGETVTLISEDYHFMPGDTSTILLTEADNGTVLQFYYLEGNKIWLTNVY